MNRLHKIVVTLVRGRWTVRSLHARAAVALAGMLLAACGQKGSLYLPAPAAAPQVAAPASTAAPAVPSTPARATNGS